MPDNSVEAKRIAELIKTDYNVIKGASAMDLTFTYVNVAAGSADKAAIKVDFSEKFLKKHKGKALTKAEIQNLKSKSLFVYFDKSSMSNNILVESTKRTTLDLLMSNTNQIKMPGYTEYTKDFKIVSDNGVYKLQGRYANGINDAGEQQEGTINHSLRTGVPLADVFKEASKMQNDVTKMATDQKNTWKYNNPEK